MTVRRKALSGFLIVCLIWGSTWTVVRVGLLSLPPIFSAGIRFAVAAGVLWFLMKLKGYGVPHERKFWKLTGVLCLTAFALPFGLIYWGQERVDSGISSVLFATFPFWVAILSHLFLPNERLTPLRFAGIMTGFCGILVIVQINSYRTVVDIPGTAAILAGAFLQAIALIAIRKKGESYNSFALNLFPMLFSSILLLGWSMLAEDLTYLKIDGPGVFSVLYLALFGTVLTFVVYFWLAKHVESVVLSLSAFITPLVALLSGVLILHEKISQNIFAGAFLVLAGVLLVNYKFIHRFASAFGLSLRDGCRSPDSEKKKD
jgi:drug/metabolite transporter (DMT)-like permease